ncbi:MAG: HEPN domain-containing protein [Sphingopyxis sp.]|nr:HEPN domain-containing protein [Sphingopyxis sp.]
MSGVAANSGRLQFQKLAELRLNDAELLLANERFSSAYYLAGYAVELGLKACISKQIVADTIPEKSFIIKVHTHDFESLTGLVT